MSEYENFYEYQNPDAYTNVIAQWGSVQIEVTHLANQVDSFTYDDVSYEFDNKSNQLSPLVTDIYRLS